MYEFARLVRELRPRSFVIENVPNLLAPKYAATLRTLLGRLKRAGYDLQAESPAVLNAADYGVPQIRKRVFIIGVESGETVPQLPAPQLSGPTVGDAINDIPDIVPRYVGVSCIRFDASGHDGLTPSYARSLRDAYRQEYPRCWDRATITHCDQTIHTAAVSQRFAALRPNEVDSVSRFRRLDVEGKCSTLLAGTGRDHGSFTAARPIHHHYPRVITVREAARLHSFPDWFQFHLTRWHGFRQIGNSVPPRLAHAVAESIVAVLWKRLPNQPVVLITPGPPTLLSMSLEEAADYFSLARSDLPADSRLTTSHRRRS